VALSRYKKIAKVKKLKLEELKQKIKKLQILLRHQR